MDSCSRSRPRARRITHDPCPCRGGSCRFVLCSSDDRFRSSGRKFLIVCGKSGPRIRPYQDLPHSLRLRLDCAIAQQSGPVDHHEGTSRGGLVYAGTITPRGLDNLRDVRSGGMKARTAHDQTTEREISITWNSEFLVQQRQRAGRTAAWFRAGGCCRSGMDRFHRSEPCLPCHRASIKW